MYGTGQEPVEGEHRCAQRTWQGAGEQEGEVPQGGFTVREQCRGQESGPQVAQEHPGRKPQYVVQG